MELRNGGAKITIADVAREAGVSPQTVSRVINNKGEIRPETRRTVLEVIERLGYRPSSIARSLATKRTFTIGLVIPDIANPFWPEIARGVENAAWERGYHVFLCNTTEAGEREQAVLQLLEDKRVDGVIVAGSRLPDEQLLPLLQRHATAVLVNRTSAPDNVGLVRVDASHGAQQAINHLLSRGRKRIGLLAGPPASHTSRGHLHGYRTTLEAAGLPVDPAAIQPCQPFLTEGYQAAITLLQNNPYLDALYCYNDLVALGAMQACNLLGRRVPDDIAIVGFDDILLASMVTPALTSLHVAKYEVGTAAASLLFEYIDGNHAQHEIVIKPNLVIRSSAP
jgi:LacI family transcriptional regulator